MSISSKFIVIFTSLLFTSSLLFCSEVQAGKKQCKSYLDKLHNIQSKQRAGYNLKQGNKLEKRAEKARKKWWQCEQGTAVSKGKINKKKHSTQNYSKQNDSKKKRSKKQSRKKETLYLTNKPAVKISPFITSKAIVIKSKYQGVQQQAWLAYYNQPKACARPKTTQQFARCVENKQKQKALFEQHYAH